MFLRSFFPLILACLLQALPAAAAESPYVAAMQAIAEGRYEDARALLSQAAAEEPEHAGAWLDLAILQCGLGHAAEAEALFSAIELRFAPSPAIREMIAQQRAHGCAPQTLPGTTRLRLGRGYDSNANQGARNPNLQIGGATSGVTLVLAPEFAPQGDAFTSLQAEGELPLSNNGLVGFGHVSWRHYDALHRYDLGSLVGGLEKPWRFHGWDVRTSAAAGVLGLGGHLYQTNGVIQAQVTPPLALPRPWQGSLVATYSMFAYPDQQTYDARQQELRAQLTYRQDGAFLQLAAGVLADCGQKERPGGDRTGQSLSLWLRIPVHALVAEMSWLRNDWRGSRDFSPGLIDYRREQQVTQWRLGLSYPIARDQAIVAEIREVNDRENISIFSYRARQASLNWHWLY